MIKHANEGEVVSTLTNKSNVTSSPVDSKIKEKYTMTQQQLFNKIAELATMFKLASPNPTPAQASDREGNVFDEAAVELKRYFRH